MWGIDLTGLQLRTRIGRLALGVTVMLVGQSVASDTVAVTDELELVSNDRFSLRF